MGTSYSDPCSLFVWFPTHLPLASRKQSGLASGWIFKRLARHEEVATTLCHAKQGGRNPALFFALVQPRRCNTHDCSWEAMPWPHAQKSSGGCRARDFLGTVDAVDIWSFDAFFWVSNKNRGQKSHGGREPQIPGIRTPVFAAHGKAKAKPMSRDPTVKKPFCWIGPILMFQKQKEEKTVTRAAQQCARSPNLESGHFGIEVRAWAIRT